MGKLLEEHSVILKAIEMGLMEEDGEEVQTGIDDSWIWLPAT
ncbi:MAG: hypothetical protein ACLTW9_24725 [Enterocloster sp.]